MVLLGSGDTLKGWGLVGGLGHWRNALKGAAEFLPLNLHLSVMKSAVSHTLLQ